jgi:hypothetical protein
VVPHDKALGGRVVVDCRDFIGAGVDRLGRSIAVAAFSPALV